MKEYYQKSTNLEEIVRSEKNIEVIEEIIKDQEEKLITQKSEITTLAIAPFIVFVVAFIARLILLFPATYVFNFAFITAIFSVSFCIIEKKHFNASIKTLKYLYKIHEKMEDAEEKLKSTDQKIKGELILTSDINSKINQERYKEEKLKELLLVEYFYRNYDKIMQNYENHTLDNLNRTPEEIDFIYGLITHDADDLDLKLVRKNKSK